ncbi:hypothetical protein D3C72_1898110 [compost metagenome]
MDIWVSLPPGTPEDVKVSPETLACNFVTTLGVDPTFKSSILTIEIAPFISDFLSLVYPVTITSARLFKDDFKTILYA